METAVEEAIKKVTYKNIFISTLLNSNFKLKQQLPVTLESDENITIAANYDLGLFGYGDSEQDAIKDLCDSIVDCYRDLKDNQAKLGPFPLQVWNFLSEIVEQK